MLRKNQFGIVFNAVFSPVFAIFLPPYTGGNNMFREAGAIFWGSLVQQLTKDFIPGFAVVFVIGTYIDLKAMGDGFARLRGVRNGNSLLFHILRVASTTLVVAVLVSLAMMFLVMGHIMPVGASFMAYLMDFPSTYVVTLVVAFITSAFDMSLIITLCRKPLKTPARL